MKLRRLIVITALIVLAIAAMIFFFSSQSAEESSSTSKGVSEWLMRLLHPEFSQLKRAEQRKLRAYFQMVTRKAAHFSEFALLGLFLRLLMEWLRFRRKGLIAWTAGTMYAVTDEIHQLFVDSRGARAEDVAIDSLGVLAGVLLMAGILWLVLGSRRRAGPPPDPEEELPCG